MIRLVSVDADEEFLNLVANVQSSQLHNQRARFLGFNADQQSGATSLNPTNGDKCKDELNKVLLQQQVSFPCIYLVFS